jgi:hypothetical protein
MIITALKACRLNGNDYAFGDTVLEADVPQTRLSFLCRRGVLTIDKSSTIPISQVTGLQTALDAKATTAALNTKATTTVVQAIVAGSADFTEFKTDVAAWTASP